MSSFPPTLDFSKEEERIKEKWKHENTFLTQNKLSKERGDEVYTFYDGPPFATGLPHYGHILAGTIKDTITRYAAMSGKYVERRAGWDCHGLPVEYEIDQKIGITHRDQVLDMGIETYNQHCRSIVTRYTEEWELTMTRLGRWIDFKNDYKTMDPTFMESVWWVFQQLFRKNLVYRGFKVMPFSTTCGTPLSNFEAGLNYKTVRDPSIIVRFPIVGETNVNFVAWTTTPWTLPSNVSLCVRDDMEYVQLLDIQSDCQYIIAKNRICQLYPIMNSKKKWKPSMATNLYKIQKSFTGSSLVGKRYQPLFEYFANIPMSENYFQVLSDDYVTDDTGTGIVHQAPAFGEDDYRVCLANHVIPHDMIHIPCPVDSNGIFTDEVPPVQGIHVKEADKTLIQIIRESGRLVLKDSLDHSYPFCWRSDTPLIYKAVPSWFIKVENIRDQILANNRKTYWVPNNVKEGRFHSWLTGARNWAVSRNRFWGTPIPIWASDDMSEIVCIGSIKELAELSGTYVTDLHRETVDSITILSRKNPGTVLKRIDEVFDCWFESGSMPYAQNHYPFENKDAFDKIFPANFIAEGLDQTRGWFYTLMVLATALFDKPAFQNLVVNGLVLAGDGKKMSKRLKNYPDPMCVIHKYGADALRMYLINSPVVRAEPLKFQEAGILGVIKEVLLPWYNAFRFFLQNVERWESGGQTFVPSIDKVIATTNTTDIWISAATQKLIKFVHEEMDAYRLYTVMPRLVHFVTQLTNWYVRLNRDRMKGIDDNNSDNNDTETGLQVLHDVLLNVTIIMAPFTPFITEYFYKHLRKLQPSYKDSLNGGGSSNPVALGKSDSVHFLQLPSYDYSRLNEATVDAMETLQTIVELGRNVREKRNISLKTPVKNIVVVVRNKCPEIISNITGPLKNYILSELNSWDFTVINEEDEHNWVTLSLVPDFSVLGKRLGKKMKSVKETIMKMSHKEAVSCLAKGKLEVEGVIIDAKIEIVSKLIFSKEGKQWEATSTQEGNLVVALNCTQDEAVLSAGMARELVNHIQRLRKVIGLDLNDIVEPFFREISGLSIVEDAVSKNVHVFRKKFKGNIPLPMRFISNYSVILGCETVEVGRFKVEISICQPSLVPRDDLNTNLSQILSTVTISDISEDNFFYCSLNQKSYTLKEGVDFWRTTRDKLEAQKLLNWL